MSVWPFNAYSKYFVVSALLGWRRWQLTLTVEGGCEQICFFLTAESPCLVQISESRYSGRFHMFMLQVFFFLPQRPGCPRESEHFISSPFIPGYTFFCDDFSASADRLSFCHCACSHYLFRHRCFDSVVEPWVGRLFLLDCFLQDAGLHGRDDN